MIELTNVSKSYNRGTVKAVDSLSLTVRPGEIFGFLGPNGAGKTTTIKMMVGLLSPDSGSIRINSVDATKQPLESKRQIGFVPDNPDLYDRLTGMEYLNFVADIFRVPAETRRQRIKHYLEVFELTGAAGDLIQSYSHGMKQKLALTAALLHDPAVFILDEPLVGLDPRSAHLLKEILREHCNAGHTVFFSTHILEVAERLCDRIGIISRGRLIACGTMDELRGQGSESLEKIFLELTEQ
ncbi:MAG: ABC transporter ATP-binding protein [Bacillota bacterium]